MPNPETNDKTRELALFNDHLRQLHRLSTTDHASLDELCADYLKTGCEIFRLRSGLITTANGDVVAAYPPESRNGIDAPVRISAPILCGAEVFGSLSFWSKKSSDERNFTAHDRELIELMAKGIGHSIYEHRLDLDRTQLTERLAHQVRKDPLTGLPNRLCFSELLENAVADARTTGKGFTVLFVDLDRFKQINDTLGHSTGDHVLEQVAARLAGMLAPEDSVGRMGGDEFTVVLRNCSTRESATEAIQKILQKLRAPYIVDDYELFVTASIGACLSPADGADARTLLQRADAAMYRAKGQGKNDYAFYGPELALRTMNRLDLENQLRRALEKGELQMCFQPLVRLDGVLDGLEALLAWENPKFGKVGAARFIPIAEESGMIVSIGGWVLKEACRQNARWQAAGYPPLRLSVNVSALQFARADFVSLVADALRESGLPPQCLELELTESIIMRDVEEAVRRMWQVRKLGVAMSIDDFGTGYSSLSYLRRLPVDALKIDRSFIAELTSTGSSLPLIQTMVVLAHNMGLNVVAEGVETREQLNLLRAIGCDKVQGHLFGEALPKAAAAELIARPDRRVPMPL